MAAAVAVYVAIPEFDGGRWRIGNVAIAGSPENRG